LTKTAKNLVVVGTEVAANFIGFLSAAYLGKTLGISNFGLVAFGMAFLSYFVILSGLGFPATGAVSLARHRSRWRQITGQVISMQIITAILLFVLYVPTSFMSAPGDDFYDLMKLYGVGILLVPLSLHWFFMGFERENMMALAQLVRQGLYLGLVLFLVHGPEDICWAPVAFLASIVVPGAILLSTLLKSGGPKFRPVRISENYALLKRGIPACFSEILLQLYYSADIIMIGWMRPVRELSLYAGAYTIITFLFAIRNQITRMLLPVLTRKKKEGANFNDIFQQIFFGLSAAALPLAVGGTFLAGPLIVFVFGEGYLHADVAFGLLVWSAAAALIGIPFTILCHVEDRQKTLLRISGSMVGFNLVANLAVIPFFGYIGAAVVTVLSELIQLILLVSSSRQFVVLNPLRPLVGPAISCVGMVLFLKWIEGSHVLVSIVGGMAVYTAVLQFDPSTRRLYLLALGKK